MSLDLNTGLLLCAVVCFVLILYSWQKADDTFDLRYILLDKSTNQVSLSKVGQTVALLVSTWVIIHETRNARLNEWLFAGYMFAWAGANFASKWLDNKGTQK